MSALIQTRRATDIDVLADPEQNFVVIIKDGPVYKNTLHKRQRGGSAGAVTRRGTCPIHMALIRSTVIASALHLAPLLAVLAAAMAVTGCADTNISNESKSDPAPGTPPMIYVENFDLGATTLKADPGTLSGRPRLIHFGQTDPAKKLEELSDLLAQSLVKDLQKKGLPAQRLVADAPRPTNGWLVSGGFLEVAEGNRMQKAVVGFGAGDSDAHLYVGVADLARPPGKQDLLDANVNSQGNKAPGGGGLMIATHTPYGMAAKYVLERDASEHDIERAAQRIADELEKLVRARTSTQGVGAAVVQPSSN